MLNLTKAETPLVIRLNIVTVVARSVRLLYLFEHMREDVHAARQCIVNDGLINAMPNMQETLLQFTTLV